MMPITEKRPLCPSMFQPKVNLILVSKTDTVVYLHDTIVHTLTFNENIKHLDETLQHSDNSGYKLYLGKCEFATSIFC